MRSLVIYIICAGLFVFGVGLFVYLQLAPKETEISAIAVRDNAPEAKNLIVDLDDLAVTWKAAGQPADMKLTLLNVDTGTRSQPFNIRSTDGQLVVPHDDYTSLLAKRGRGEANRLRVEIQGKSKTFSSDAFDLKIGMTLEVLVEPAVVNLAMLIDSSDINGYRFNAKLVVPESRTLNYLSVGGDIDTVKKFKVPHTARYDWDSARAVYFGPDDPKLVRINFDR